MRAVPTATSLRLVAPQRVQIHSAVVAAVAMRSAPTTGGDQLLEGAPDELWRLGGGTGGDRRPHRVICCRDPIAQSHECPDRLFRLGESASYRWYDDITEAVLQF